jgi:hypothetical protein
MLRWRAKSQRQRSRTENQTVNVRITAKIKSNTLGQMWSVRTTVVALP